MTITFPRLLALAWQILRRDAAILVPLAGCFMFLPALAVLLVCDPVPPVPPAPRDQAMMEAWLQAVTIWARGNALAYVVADLLAIFGAAAAAVLLLDARRPALSVALRLAALRFWPFAVASLVAAVPVGLGLWLLILPGLYVQARLLAALPALAHRSVLGGLAALRLSLRLTRGHGLALTGAVVALFLAQWLALAPLLSADAALRAAARPNPLALTLVDAAIAAIGAAYRLNLLLVGVAFYRTVASRGT